MEEKKITRQDIEFLIENADILANYDEKVAKYNANCRHYIRTPEKVYEERVLDSVKKLFNGISEKEKKRLVEILSFQFQSQS